MGDLTRPSDPSMYVPDLSNKENSAQDIQGHHRPVIAPNFLRLVNESPF